MRRAKSGPGVSPTLLRHFAVATLAITFCIAIFADADTGETVRAVAKRPSPPKAQVNLIGASRQANNNLTVKPARTMPEEDPPLNDQDFGYPARPSTTANLGGTMVSGKSQPIEVARPEDLLPARQAALRARKQPPPGQPSDADLARLLEASRVRSGASNVE